MTRLALRRAAAILPVALIASFGVFMLASLVPGDAALTLAGGELAEPERVQEIREELHLDEPLVQQYARWLSGAVKLDFGSSLASGGEVTEEISRRVPVTLSLVAAALVVGLLLGVPLGILSAVWPKSWPDHTSRFVVTIAAAIPNFCIGIALVVLVAVRMRALPPSGYVPIDESPSLWLEYIALPALTLGLGLAATIARQLRGSLVDVLSSNYVRAAWAKGVSRSGIVLRHGLRNAAGPALTVVGVSIGHLLGGAVIVEEIFAIPGLGSLMLRSIGAADLPVIQGLTLVFVLCQVTMSLLADLGQAALNPKVREA